MKTQQEIETSIIQNFASLCSTVVNFMLGSVIRGIITAISGTLADIWNDLVQSKRQSFIDTSSGLDLDTLANRRGLTRNAASASSVILVFSGTVGTVVPQGTQVISTTGITYQTTTALTIASTNPGYNGPAVSESLGNSVIAESTIVGAVSMVPANSLNSLVTPITGISAMNNPVPSQGGADAEDDDIFSIRIREQISLDDQSTQAYYEAAVMAIDATVLRALAVKGSDGGVNVILVKNSGAAYTTAYLHIDAAAIQAVQRSFTSLICSNISFTGLAIAFNTTLATGTVLADYYVQIANAIADLIDWKRLDFGSTITLDSIANAINGNSSTGNLSLPTLMINGSQNDAMVGWQSLARFISLSITDITNPGSPVTLSGSLNQAYAG